MNSPGLHRVYSLGDPELGKGVDGFDGRLFREALAPVFRDDLGKRNDTSPHLVSLRDPFAYLPPRLRPPKVLHPGPGIDHQLIHACVSNSSSWTNGPRRGVAPNQSFLGFLTSTSTISPSWISSCCTISFGSLTMIEPPTFLARVSALVMEIHRAADLLKVIRL